MERDHAKMSSLKPKSGRIPPPVAKTSLIIFAVPLLAFAIATMAQAAPVAQSGTGARISYDMDSDPLSLTLCQGELAVVNMYAFRKVRTSPSTVGVQRLQAAKISGIEENNDIVELVPSQTAVETNGPDSGAFFQVRGKEVGETTLIFDLVPTTDTATGLTISGPESRVKIEVVPCYEAYKSSLVTTWIQKAVCTYRETFTLMGPAQARTGLIALMTTVVFEPTPYDSDVRIALEGGTYTLISRWKGLTETSQGEWEVLAPPGVNTNEFEEIHLKGIGIAVYDNGITVSDPSPTESLYLVETKLASPGVCVP